MGAKPSSARERSESWKQLLATTNFTKPELKRIRRSFLNDCPNGVLGREQFCYIFASLLPWNAVRMNQNEYAYENHLFRSFDCNKDGRLDFVEFVQALSTLQRGTAQDKLNWIFRMYDIDGDGEITKEEFVEIVNLARTVKTSLREEVTFGGSCSYSHPDNRCRRSRASIRRARAIAQVQASDVFNLLDRKKSGRVNLEDFVKSVEESPRLQDKVLTLMMREEESIWV